MMGSRFYTQAHTRVHKGLGVYAHNTTVCGCTRTCEPVYTRWHIHTCAHTQSHTHVHTLSLDPEGGGRSLKQETVPKRLLF